MTSKEAPSSNQTIAIQSWLRPALTAVSANCNYHRFREELKRIDANIRASHVEAMAVEFALETLPAKARMMDRKRRARFAGVALRLELGRGKAGKEVEFGNGLYLAGSVEGYLLDYHLYQDQPPSDARKHSHRRLQNPRHWDRL